MYYARMGFGKEIQTDVRSTDPAAGEKLADRVANAATEIGALMKSVAELTHTLKERIADGRDCAPVIECIEQAVAKAEKRSAEISECARNPQGDIRSVSLKTIACRVLAAQERELAPRVQIVRHVDPDAWDVVGHAEPIYRLVLNLALNAVESIKDTGKVTLRTRNVQLNDASIPRGANLSPGRHVVLSIEARGGGMAPDVLAHVKQGASDASSHKHFLGLDTVRETVRRYGGHLHVTQESGWGVSFQLYLPAYKRAEIRTPLEWSRLPKGNETVLVVDDNPMILDVAQEVLGQLGYKTLRAANGREAVDVARAYDGEIHLALLDQVMPVMSGAEACPRLKEARPSIKIILCTGYDNHRDMAKIFDAGADGCILKPFPLAKLAHEIRRVLDKAPANQPVEASRPFLRSVGL